MNRGSLPDSFIQPLRNYRLRCITSIYIWGTTHLTDNQWAIPIIIKLTLKFHRLYPDKKNKIMKNNLLLFISILFIAIGANGQNWEIDVNHSSVMFNAKHYGISFINGRFLEFEATVEGGTPEDFTDAKVAFTAQVGSVSTGAEGRDKHLKNADFFDMDNNPTIGFVSKSFTRSSDNMYKVVGDLTMRGNTKEVELSAHHIGSTKTRDERHKVGFQLTGSVNRNDFGVSGAAGGVAPIVEIVCNVEMAEKKSK